MPTHNQQALWLIGSGRSGTTWLQRMLVHLLDGEMCFEPLHPDDVKLPPLQPPMRHTNSRPYIRATQPAPTWAAFIHTINAGRLHSPWLDLGYETSRWRWLFHRLRRRFHLPQMRVVKSIRATLLTGWLKQHLHLPVVILIRHPCAVVASQARLGWYMNAYQFLEESQLVEDYLYPHTRFIRNIQDEWAHCAAFWAIENLVASDCARQWGIPILFYEHLVLHPEETLRTLFNRLGYTWDEARWAKIRTQLITRTAQSTIDRWRQTLDAHVVRTILDTVHTLGVSLYDESSLPLLE